MLAYILTSNLAISEEFETEIGLSIYIKTSKHNILVDAGKSDVFIRNAKKLNLDLQDVDICFLSHGHSESSGGLAAFLELNKKAKVYSNADVFGKYYNCDKEFIGLSNELKKYKERFVFIDEEYFIDDNLQIFSGNDRKTISPVRADGFTAKSNSSYLPDDFHHEQYLVITEKNGPKVLISGCSHKGINNIVYWLRYDKISTVISGFHYKDFDMNNQKVLRNLDIVSEDLCQYNIQYYTGSCTGVDQFNYMKEKMQDKLKLFHSGEIIELK